MTHCFIVLTFFTVRTMTHYWVVCITVRVRTICICDAFWCDHTGINSSFNMSNTWDAVYALTIYKVLLWSQIKLSPYDFNDLQITGEFENRPGTVRIVTLFLCVHAYSKSTGRRLYMYIITSAYASSISKMHL